MLKKHQISQTNTRKILFIMFPNWNHVSHSVSWRQWALSFTLLYTLIYIISLYNSWIGLIITLFMLVICMAFHRIEIGMLPNIILLNLFYNFYFKDLVSVQDPQKTFHRLLNFGVTPPYFSYFTESPFCKLMTWVYLNFQWCGLALGTG